LVEGVKPAHARSNASVI